MNRYLKGWEEKRPKKKPAIQVHKGLCEMAGINEEIEIVKQRGERRVVQTFLKFQKIGVHTGRKTFSTLSLELGMSAEETMAITGHKDYRSFQRYIKVTEKRKKQVMAKAWGEPKLKSMKSA